jgi:hypothetical protein
VDDGALRTAPFGHSACRFVLAWRGGGQSGNRREIRTGLSPPFREVTI